MSEIDKKVLEIVDDDIAVLFSNKPPETYAINLPIKMQLARSLKKMVALMSAKKSQDRDDSTDNRR
jgi:hypothetical protein